MVPPPEHPLLLLSLIHEGLKFSFSVAAFLFLKLDNLVLLNVTLVLLESFPPLLALQFLCCNLSLLTFICFILLTPSLYKLCLSSIGAEDALDTVL